MRVAVLGANGLIGKTTARHLASIFDVTPITRQVVDLSNSTQTKRYFDNNAFDIVINAAINSDSRMDADNSIAKDNLNIFANLYASRNSFGRVIQFGSGAEFDRKRSIDNVHEEDLFVSNPTDPYGMSKNLCSRIAYSTDNWYNLRLFGVFHPSESSSRLLPRILSKIPITIEDRYFDYFCLEDLLPIIEHYCVNKNPRYKDINITYPDKMLLGEFVSRFCKINKLSEYNIKYGNYNELAYTGNCSKLQSLDLPTLGIDLGLSRYIRK